jgi:FkbM family methyltransferase
MIWSKLSKYGAAIHLRASLLLEFNNARNSGSIIPSTIKRRIWREPHNHEEYIWLLRFVSNKEEVRLIDIGGNSGYWAQDFMMYYPKARIFAFEPVDEMYEQYVARFRKNMNVTVFHTALGDLVEQKEINVAKGYGLTSFNTYDTNLEDKNIHFEKKLTVTINKLDTYISEIDFLDPRITVIKVDVQGFETKVILGGLEVFRKADLVIIECSFVNEFRGVEPTFGDLVTLLRAVDLHPIQFGVFDRSSGPIAYERNVLFVKSKYFANIWH